MNVQRPPAEQIVASQGGAVFFGIFLVLEFRVAYDDYRKRKPVVVDGSRLTPNFGVVLKVLTLRTSASPAV